jgi:hypothetical protein
MKLEFSQGFFEKYANVKFNENPYSGSRAFACEVIDGQTDRHVEANSRFSQLCKRI